MKETFKKIAALLFAGVLGISVAGCDTIKSGSKLKTGDITVSYIDADGDTQTRALGFELYKNLAPDTIEHFIYLAEQGYYNGTVISNVTDNYMEFGSYYYGSDGKLVSKYDKNTSGNYNSYITDSYVAGKYFTHDKSILRYIKNDKITDYNDYSIRGEFSANGVSGNSISLSGGALVLKHDYIDNENSVYNTGKGTVAITFGSGSYFSSSTKYCIFGKLVSDDADSDEDIDDSVTYADSLLTDYYKDDDGNIYYYYDYADSDYLKANTEMKRYFKYSDGTYYAMDSDNKYTVQLDDDYEDLLDEFDDNKVHLLNLPYHAITITGISFDK